MRLNLPKVLAARMFGVSGAGSLADEQQMRTATEITLISLLCKNQTECSFCGDLERDKERRGESTNNLN